MSYKRRTDLNYVEKIYWYLRFLVEGDKGSLHKSKDKLIALREALGATLSGTRGLSEADRLDVLKGVLVDVVLKGVRDGTSRYTSLTVLLESLTEMFETTDDIKAFVFCLDKLLIPSTEALENVPTVEATEIARVYATNVLDKLGTDGLANILLSWDSITLDICLNRERDIAAKLFKNVRKELEKNRPFEIVGEENAPESEDIVLSALMQEFERRLGQKRKQRSGQDLEDATSFIFDYYKIACAEKPSHFTAAIEVDNWVKDKKGWYIGFSLKRTLRERWKQTVVDKDTLTEFKIRYIVHLICNDSDLSDAKIGDMGAKRHLFFVPDSSHILRRVEDDTVLKDYVHPMSTLIDFLKSV